MAVANAPAADLYGRHGVVVLRGHRGVKDEPEGVERIRGITRMQSVPWSFVQLVVGRTLVREFSKLQFKIIP